MFACIEQSLCRLIVNFDRGHNVSPCGTIPYTQLYAHRIREEDGADREGCFRPATLSSGTGGSFELGSFLGRFKQCDDLLKPYTGKLIYEVINGVTAFEVIEQR